MKIGTLYLAKLILTLFNTMNGKANKQAFAITWPREVSQAYLLSSGIKNYLML